VTEGKI